MRLDELRQMYEKAVREQASAAAHYNEACEANERTWRASEVAREALDKCRIDLKVARSNYEKALCEV